MKDDSSHSKRIDTLADEYLTRKRRGDNPTIKEYCTKYPDLAEDIRELFPTLEMMEDLKPSLSSTHAARGVPPSVERIGDYRILGEIGRGGMGVVYEAEQESLGRRVALKVLSERFSNDDSGLLRFQREARAAAKMHHTNIVPVFEIGQESGYIFYAMQLIQGQSLDMIIKDMVRLRAHSEARKKSDHRGDSAEGESALTPVLQDQDRTRPDALAHSLVTGRFRTEALVESSPWLRRSGTRTDTDGSSTKQGDTATSAVLPGGTDLSTTGTRSHKYYRSVAQIGRQVADALAYSHARGVVHRDIKPSNLLLDTGGIIWITDFGIARSDNQDITHTGDIVGTIRYMSPGRLRGRWSELSDIYALGLTLYELLVLRPAFDSTDRLELMEMIKESEPAVPRSIDPHIPIDLETIILKAIDKESASRYQSADDMAEDLRRFIEDEPIKARRVSIPERLVRWSRRNRRLAISLSAVAMLIVCLAVGATVAWFRESKLRQLAVQHGDTITRNLYFAEMNLAGQAAAEPYGADTVKARLSEWLPQKAGVDLRGWEWYYLYSLVHRERFSLGRLGAWTWSVDFSPDGKQFAAAVNDFGFKIWDSATGRLILEKKTGSMRSVAFSPDGTRLATTAFAGKVNVWQVSNGAELLQLKGHTSAIVNCVAWSPDGRWLATGSSVRNEEHMLRIWDAATGEEIRKLHGHTESVRVVQWSPDGSLLATASIDGTARIWDAATGEEQRRFPNTVPDVASNPVLAMCWSPDGSKLVSAGVDGTIRVWDVATENAPATLKVDAGPVQCVSWRPGISQLASAHYDGTVRLWDVGTGQELSSYFGHTHEVRCVKWSPDGSLLASTGLDGTVRVWNIHAGYPMRTLHHGRNAECIDWSRDSGRLAAGRAWGDAEGEVVVWETQTGKRHVVHRSLWAGAVAWSPDDERLAFAGRDTVVRVWEASTDKVVTLDGETGWVRSITWNHDGSRLASTDEDGNVSIWNMDTNNKISTIAKTHPYLTLSAVDWSCDGRRLATIGSDAFIKVWDPATSELIWQVKSDQDETFSVRWSPDGTKLATAHNGAVVLWDGLTGARIKTLDEIEEEFRSVDWSPDATRLATGSKASVSVWDVASGHVALRIPIPNTVIKCVRWNRDGRRLATCGYGEPIRIYDATIGYQQNAASATGLSIPD